MTTNRFGTYSYYLDTDGDDNEQQQQTEYSPQLEFGKEFVEEKELVEQLLAEERPSMKSVTVAVVIAAGAVTASVVKSVGGGVGWRRR